MHKSIKKKRQYAAKMTIQYLYEQMQFRSSINVMNKKDKIEFLKGVLLKERKERKELEEALSKCLEVLEEAANADVFIEDTGLGGEAIRAIILGNKALENKEVQA
tara:strand:- start:4 stop:318 length:315 start_codon:yes stop_codon:yes gene_type:complete